jgi:hypothetical protein
VEQFPTSRKDIDMSRTTYSLRPLWAEIRAEWRGNREARAQHRALQAELASYTSDSDLNDMDAILDRYDDAETHDIRSILATQRSA